MKKTQFTRSIFKGKFPLRFARLDTPSFLEAGAKNYQRLIISWVSICRRRWLDLTLVLREIPAKQSETLVDDVIVCCPGP